MNARSYVLGLAALVVAMAPMLASPQGTQEIGKEFRYARLYSDNDGVSHFEDVTVKFQMRDFAPPASPMGVAALSGAKSASVVSVPLGWDGIWHPTPRKQWAVILSGRIQVTAGDGEVRTFGPGDTLLLADTSGRGHLAEVVSPEGHVAIMVAVSDAGD